MKRDRQPLRFTARVTLALGLSLTGLAAAQNNLQIRPNVQLNTNQLLLPGALQLKLQSLPNFGAQPIFRSLDAAASSQFLNGNTIWLTSQSIEANRQARIQNLQTNVSRLQPLASQPRIQAVLNAVQLEGLQEPLLEVQTKSGPLTVKLMSADVGASLAATSLDQDAASNAQVAANQMARIMNIDPAMVQRVAQAAPGQRQGVVMQMSSDIARLNNSRQLSQFLKPAGTGSGLDAKPASCPPAANGLFATYDFPMKKNLPAVKNQGARGTCWAFATVSSAETIIRSQYNQNVDLSEQDYVAYTKLKYGSPTDADGGDPFKAMQLNAQNSYRFAFENAWEYNQSLYRSSTETPADSGKYTYANSCQNYPHQDQCEDSVSQAETGCIISAGKTVCGAQIPTSRTNYGLETTYLRDSWDWKQKDGGMGWAVFALGFGTPVMLLHDARYLKADARGFVGDLPYNVVSHQVKQADGSKKWVQNGESDVNWWNHIAQLVGYIDNSRLHTVLPGAPDGPGGGYFIMKNSWGSCWADGGYIYLSWNWVKKYGGGLYFGQRITND